jgi:pyruvate ferredoxin oxidoreductase alpha subunit
MLPVSVNIDGFQLTHMVEPVILPSQEEVDAFLPPFVPHATLHPSNPVTMGAFSMSDYFTEIMKAKDEAIKNSRKVILEVWDEWGRQFGRSYKPVETYRAEDADILMLTMGSMGETAKIAIDELRGKGVRAGLVKLRLWRPFPFAELKAAVKKRPKTDCDRPRRFLRRSRRSRVFGNKVRPVCPSQAPVDLQLYHRPGRPRHGRFGFRRHV